VADVPTPIRNDSQDVIKAGTLRLTWISGIVGALAAIGTTWDSFWAAIYGHPPSDWIRTAVLIAIVSAWAVIASTDMASRAYASARLGARVVSLPSAASAEWNPSGGTHQVVVAALRFTPTDPETVEYLVLRADGPSAWVPASELTFA
jgi:hypothetical protein